MHLRLASFAQWAEQRMGEAHRGILPHYGQLLAFGNRGQDEVAPFKDWLREHKYGIEGFGVADDSWAMLIKPPARMRDTRAVLTALWAASPDAPGRKSFQRHIADLHVRLVLAREWVAVDRSWFTKAEVKGLAVLSLTVVDSLSFGPSTPVSRRSIEPSLN